MITGEGVDEDNETDTPSGSPSVEPAQTNHSSEGTTQNLTFCNLLFSVGHIHGVDAKVICYIDRLLELAGSKCRFCQMPCKRFTKVVGCALELNMVCSAGHSYNWASSPVLTNSSTSVMYKINLAFSSALLLSGNNYYKLRQFCRFMTLKCLSPSTYFSHQRLCLCPVIQDFYYKKMAS